jgi:acetolactate synthase-1/2/3 large subunit
VAALAPFRRIVLAGCRAPVAFFAYPDKPGLLAPPQATLTSLATVDDDVVAALQALADELGASATAPAGVAPFAPPDANALPTGRVTPEGIGQVIGALMPANTIVVDESVSTGRAFGAAWANVAPHDWLTAMGGSIGFALPVAVGAAIAAPDRKVLALDGDGSAMYTIQSLWTMARESLDVTIVIFANRSYNILRGEFAGVGGGTPGPRATDMLTLDRPELDFVSIARGMGLQASRASELGEFATQLRAALAHRGPALVELVF